MSSENSGPRPSAAAGGRGAVADVNTLRALGHPVRMALMDALLGGPLSATEAGEAIGESATTCSFHLRQLEKYGLVRVHETGPGRRRTWKLTETHWRIPAALVRAETAQVSMYETIVDRFLGRARDAMLELAKHPEDGWDDVSTSSRSQLYLTKAELAEFSRQLDGLVRAFHDRVGVRVKSPHLRPRGSLPVEVILFAVPAAPERPGKERYDHE